MKTLDHPNIIRVIEFYEDPKYYYTVNQTIKGKDMFEYIVNVKMLSEPLVARIMV
jgi:calcium-dependent protein kinase